MAERDTTGGMVAFLVGLGIGVAVAILYAPQAGDETRNLLGQAAKQGKECVSDLAQQFRSEIGISTTGVKDRLQQAVAAGKNAYREEIRQTREEPLPH
jgi:gas vesicle protein